MELKNAKSIEFCLDKNCTKLKVLKRIEGAPNLLL